jgi:TonB family protein
MKWRLLLRVALCVACSPLLFAQDKQSTNEEKSEPPAARSDEKSPNPSASRTKHGPIDILNDTGGVDVHSYLGRALPLLKQSWYIQIPESSTFKRGKVTVKFHIQKDGQITDVSYVDSTGDPGLDLPAYRGVTSSSPLPSLPGDYRCNDLVLQIHFCYNLNVTPSDPKLASLIPCVTTRISSVQPFKVAVSPTSAEVVTEAKQQFTAVVTGEPSANVNWTVTGSGCAGSTCGSISLKDFTLRPPSLRVLR